MATVSAQRSTDKHVRVQALAAELYCEQRERLLATARRNAANPADAEEALQDAFALFINHFDPDCEAPPLAWITLTLKRRCWAAYRHQRLLPMQPLSSNPPATPVEASSQRPLHELAEATHDAKRLHRAFAHLKPNERRALSMLALGYTYKDIASRTGWTYTKVNRCISEGRAALRLSLDSGLLESHRDV